MRASRIRRRRGWRAARTACGRRCGADAARRRGPGRPSAPCGRRPCRAASCTGCPSTRTRPPVTGARPQMARSTVDLPEPDSPTSPKDCAGLHVEAHVLDRIDAHAARAEDDVRDSGYRASAASSQRPGGVAVEDRQRAHVVARASAGSSAGPAYRDAGRLADARPRSSSTTWPAYMTSTRSQKDETSCRSCEMKIRPMPRSRHELVEDAQHLELHRHVERRGRLVGDQQVGLGDQHHGDHRALAHAARDLVRIERRRRGCGSRICTASSMASALSRASALAGLAHARGRPRRSARRWS